MKRIIDHFLLEWKGRKSRKPLLIHGARQVGKTHAVHNLGATFESFLEFNLEKDKEAQKVFEADLNIDRILQQLSALSEKPIISGTTLLFIDEIQKVPQAIVALRYFRELIPDLHVIAAGSLVDLVLGDVDSFPVGRIESLYMYPMSFFEYLVACDHAGWAKLILTKEWNDHLLPMHDKLLTLVGEYLAIGGMPEVVNEWLITKTVRDARRIQNHLLYTYRRDFNKYGKRNQIKYLRQVFNKAIEQLSQKFMYSYVGEYQKRELEPALDKLVDAGLLHKVVRVPGQGSPIGDHANSDDFKIIFVDVGLTQALKKWNIRQWILDPNASFVNKGTVVESFVGQEILAYSDPMQQEELFYWRREERSSQAEIDYLLQVDDTIIPIEVKGGASKRIKSMYIFLENHPNSPYGIRFSTLNYEKEEKLLSYPLYSVAKPLADANEEVKKALLFLVE